jgi:hypothetical protein
MLLGKGAQHLQSGHAPRTCKGTALQAFEASMYRAHQAEQPSPGFTQMSLFSANVPKMSFLGSYYFQDISIF